jgi:hypothetical protein
MAHERIAPDRGCDRFFGGVLSRGLCLGDDFRQGLQADLLAGFILAQALSLIARPGELKATVSD